MANTRSAAKRARQSVKRRARNKSVNSAVRTYVRKAREALTGGDAESIDAAVRKAISELSKAASKGVLHARNASRRVARLAAAANKTKAGAEA